ncbi:hypothetical protein E2562_025432 [Oryza meyeriana var. granulata]|uniref:Uncharacterized protein n=1 Tax=Oryza meyeriana var. granulata TaxID=110450 RepID=A0A6G1D6X3_9ORYZ|nr:hypothetical protein E2562_025432 [Oryza meyeriana var. granulata]
MMVRGFRECCILGSNGPQIPSTSMALWHGRATSPALLLGLLRPARTLTSLLGPTCQPHTHASLSVGRVLPIVKAELHCIGLLTVAI